MKYLLYIALLTGTLLLSAEGNDVGKLIPVEILAITENEDTVTVTADTGDAGTGKSLEDAIGDMEDTASGVIYLDTAEYVILEPGTERYLPTLRTYLKDTVRVCRGQEGMVLEGLANYLSVHRPEARLKGVSEFGEIPMILEENGRYLLVENNSKNLKLGIDK